MPASNSQMIHKLQIALNSRGMKILVGRSQFYSEEQKRPVTMYKVSQAHFDEVTGRTKNAEIFTSYSEIQVVLFMRNLWFLIQGKDIPPTNKMKGAIEFERKWKEFEEQYKLSQTK